MIGLMIKDLKIMLLQKNFLFMILAVVIGMMILNEDVIFPLCFLSFVMSLFVLTTISYDEFDNGNAFLFTLPITRREYVIEKYGLALLLGSVSWIAAVLMGLAASSIKGTMPIADLLMMAFLIVPMIILMQAIMLPFQLKFGGEKGRIAMIGVFGAIAVLGILLTKGADFFFHIDVFAVLDRLTSIHMGILLLLLTLIALFCLYISLKVSLSIMKHKEF